MKKKPTGKKTELLPCPLCGGEPKKEPHGIVCRKCGLWLGDGTKASEHGGCVKLWNTRTNAG